LGEYQHVIGTVIKTRLEANLGCPRFGTFPIVRNHTRLLSSLIHGVDNDRISSRDCWKATAIAEIVDCEQQKRFRAAPHQQRTAWGGDVLVCHAAAPLVNSQNAATRSTPPD
jgi:hypothetical protein